MYNDYFGFRENPFNQTPDSSFFFPSASHRSALDALEYAIRQSKGFVVITGEIGSGKTTIARTLLRRLGDQVRTAVITNTHLTPKGIITMILEDLGVAYSAGSKDKLLIQLNEFLIQQAEDRQDVVLLIDEAQNLSPMCLEEVRMLSNLETEKDKLIQIILLGQPELRRKLEMARLEQLRQRIAIHYHLAPLNDEETKQYILHRIDCVKTNGRQFDNIFQDETWPLIYRYSRGLPRIINHLCDNILLSACLAEVTRITVPLVVETIQELRFGGKRHEQIYQSA